MSDVPDSVIHWLLAAAVPSIGALFLYLIKRTFTNFEEKIGEVFGKLEIALKQANEHRTEIEVIKNRLVTLESKRRRG